MDFPVNKSENSCRICLSSAEWDLVELFSQGEGENHAYKLNFCAGIELYEGDQLPQKICSECLQSVEAACKIKKKCIMTDQLLRQHLNSQQNAQLETVAAFDFTGGVNIKIEPNTDWYTPFDTPSYDQAKAELHSDDDYDWPEPPIEPNHDELPEAIGLEQDASTMSESNDDKFKISRPRAEDYMCLFCKKVFPKIVEKKRHLEQKHKSTRICRICKRKRGTVVAAENCMRDHLYGHKFLCQICAKPFRKKGHMDDHIRGVHLKTEAEMPTCDLCGAKCKYKANMQRHLRTVHMNHKISCPHTDTCPDVVYTTVISLNHHLYRHHNVAAPVNCEKCGLGFTTASELKAHLKRVCSGPEGAKVKRAKKLKLKVFYNEVDGKFHCTLCPKVCASKKYYQDHFQNYHRDNKTCTICNRTFASFVSYRRHKKSVHDKIRDFFCGFPGCSKAFSMKSGQLAHRKTHLKG